MRIVIVLVLLGAASAGCWWYVTRERPIEVTAVKVEVGPVEKTVAAIASGTVMPRDKAMLAIGAIGTIAAVHVNEGDRIEAGQVLVELEHAELDAQVALAEANLRVGEARLAQSRIAAAMSEDVTSTQVRQAQAQLNAAQKEYDRVAPLSERQAISRSDFEKAALALKVAQETVAAAVAATAEIGLRGEDVASAEAMMDQLRAAVAVAEAMREKAFLRAPFAGVVAKVMLSRGEAVAMGMPVLSLVSGDNVYIEAPFDEANAGELTVGLPVRIELDAYPDEHFEGIVDFISPVIQPNADLARTLNVKVAIQGDRARFLPGMSADVTVIVDRRESVVHVPSEALVRDEYGYVIEGGRAVRRPVKLGIGNWEYQEVLEGVKEGETLIMSVGVPGLDDGVLVTVTSEEAGA